MAVAYKQYVIITKIRVYRTLKLNMKHQKRKQALTTYADGKMALRKKEKVYNLIIQNAANRAIKRSLVSRADQFRMRQRLQQTFRMIELFKNIQVHQRLVLIKAKSDLQRKRVARCFAELSRYAKYSQKKAHLKQICEKHIAEAYLPGLKFLVLIALHKSARKERTNRQAAELFYSHTVRKCFKVLQESILISQYIKNQHLVSQ